MTPELRSKFDAASRALMAIEATFPHGNHDRLDVYIARCSLDQIMMRILAREQDAAEQEAFRPKK